MAAPLRLLRLRWAVADGAPAVHLHGDLDAHARVDVDAIAVVADEVPKLVIDVSEVHFADIVGLDLLESLAARENVVVRGRSLAVQRVLDRTSNIVDDWRALRAALEAR